MYYEKIHGFFDFADLYDKMVKRFPDGSIFVEIGVWQGKSLCYMAEKIKMANKQITLYGVDTWRWMGENKLKSIVEANNGDMFPVFLENMKKAGVLDVVKPIRTTSVAAAEKFNDRTLDFIFIDGGHSSTDVYNDIEAWQPKLKKDGIIAGHDYKSGNVRSMVAKHYGNRAKKCSVDSWIVEKEEQDGVKI